MEFIDTMAECSDSGGEEEQEVLTVEDESFIDNTQYCESPPRKLLKQLCESLEKSSLEKKYAKYDQPGPSVSKRVLFPERHVETQEDSGMLTYDELSMRDNYEINELVNTETLFEEEFIAPVVEVQGTLSAQTLEQKLRTSYYHFTAASSPDKIGVRWNDVHKGMKSPKTMQKIWSIFVERPVEVRRNHPNCGKRSHVPLEALLCNDAALLRASSTPHHVYYLLEYTDSQRSIKGLQKLLKAVGIEHCLFGVPYFKQPLTRTFLRDSTTPLDVKRDVSFLADIEDEKYIKQSYQFNMEELISYCESSEPETVQQLIYRYTSEAKHGDPNAIAWRNTTSCMNHAKNAFSMWKSTVQGEMLDLSLSDYILHRISENEGGDAAKVRRLFTIQGILEIDFLNTLRKWLVGQHKYNVIVLVGPGNTGKSLFTEALMKCLGGAFLSWHKDNQYWKSPILGSRFCCIDDITLAGWKNLDECERRALDGGIVTINKKFTQPTEVKFPPCLITTNTILTDADFSFLKNRLVWYTFDKVLVTRDGLAEAAVSTADCAAWLLLNRNTLDL
ncbi:MAG: E1 protein [Lutjanus campechanus-associated papillomavirus 1]|uniref:DNA 3'-5' helicase n=1 Tax=Lutjanus campechanus-associated papillomavirus 1 TaxID=2683335 RepID=A0A8M0HG62_9PAPI|nr:MAG: E1 protein [Lutjanus campechanus-associated papillomavirus 1]